MYIYIYNILNIYVCVYSNYFYSYSNTKDFAKQRYNTPYACNVI